MSDDERFEQFLRDAAADYQAPRGEVPRDDMWAAIQAQRGARTASTPVTPLHPPVMHRAAPRGMWIGLAATLVLGVLIGRYTLRTEPSRNVAGVNAAATTPPMIAPTLGAPATATPAGTPPRASDGGTTSPTARQDIAAVPVPNTTSYSVASARHLQAVQLLLVSFAADSADARSDSLVSTWARGLLSNTRLLLDSPAARDPQRARLLQDLEVILVQLVQRAPGGDADARSAVERSIQKSQIIPRLRSALPASLQSGTE